MILTSLIVYAIGSLLDIASSIGIGTPNGTTVQERNPLWRGKGGTFRWAHNLLVSVLVAPLAVLIPFVGWFIGIVRGLVGLHNVWLRICARRRNRPEALRRRWLEQERANGWQPPEQGTALEDAG